MKKFLLTTGFLISVYSAFAQPCSLANFQVSVSTGADGKCYADINFDMDRNNGNKFIYVHLWNAAEYSEVNKNRWKKGSGPKKADIEGSNNSHPALATIAINNTNYNAPVFSSYGYRPDPTVTSRTGSAISVSPTPVSGSGPKAFYRYTVHQVPLGSGAISGGCMISNMRGIVWSTQANSQNSHIHCSLIGANAPLNPLTVTGSANCAFKQYSLTVKNNTTIIKQAEFDIYADNSGGVGGNPNGVFDPLTDTKFDSGYFAVNGSSTFTLTRAIPDNYLNFDLWAQIILADGTTQLAKLTTNSCGPLPVSLSAFNASRNKQSVLLKWHTSSEQSMKGFDIERSTGNGWESVAFIPTKSLNGNSNANLSYDFTDLNQFKGVSQYRLRIVNLDEKYGYSDIRLVKGEIRKNNILLYPNPGIDGQITVSFDEPNLSRNITVTDMSGRVVKQLKATSENKIRFENLKPGMYNLQVTNISTGETIVEKMMIAE